MRSFIAPSSVVLIGASRRSGSGAYNNLEMMLRYGYRGEILVVHPSVPDILGHDTFPSVDALPEVPELAVVSVGRDGVFNVVSQCAERGIKHVIVITQGFAEADDRGRRLQDGLAALARRSGTRVLGPNTMGALNAFDGFSTAFLDLPRPADPPPLALVAQSGVFQVGPREFIGELGKALDVGNSCDVDCVDGLELFEDDPQVEVIALYLEGVTRGKLFFETAARVASKKPLIVLKAGRSAAGADAVMSHTGCLVGEDAVFDAVLERAGAVRVSSIAELRAACRALLQFKPMKGPRVAVVTCTGAAGIISADCCEDYGLELAPFPKYLHEELKVPRLAWYRLANPADIWPPAMGSGNYVDFMKRAVGRLLRDDDIDGVVGILVSMDSPLHRDQDLVAAARELSQGNPFGKPVALWLYGSGAERQSGEINGARLPDIACFGDLDMAMAGLSAAWRYSELQEREAPAIRGMDADTAPKPGRRLVIGEAAESLMKGYGLTFAPGGLAGTATEAAALADRLGYPVVMKIISHEWLHKSDRGGVLLDIGDRGAVESGFAALKERFEKYTPAGMFDGVQVQRQMRGIELLLGIKRDPQFGPIIAVGMGGIYTELLRDVAQEPAPVTITIADRMLSRLRAAPLLMGARGRHVRRQAILDALVALSELAMDHPEIEELDLNPVIVNGDGCHCVDARIIRG
jgi:acetyltransferase